MPARMAADAAYLLFSVYVSAEDIRKGAVSRFLLLGAIGAGLAWRGVAEGRTGLAAGALGCGIGLGIFGLVFFCSGGKLGLADVWYAGLAGVMLGPVWWFGGMLAGCVPGMGYGLLYRRRSIPFIPFMAAGSVGMLAAVRGIWRR